MRRQILDRSELSERVFRNWNEESNPSLGEVNGSGRESCILWQRASLLCHHPSLVFRNSRKLDRISAISAGRLLFLSAAAQTTESQIDVPHGLAAHKALALVPRSAVDTASPDSRAAVENAANAPRVIVIGFMGGFAKSDDPKHPEVQFAQYLREQYRSDIHAEVFGNHHGRKALQEVQRLLDGDGDGTLSSDEKEDARIIIYGHSWGATETVAFARELGKRGIPVLLTVQIDSIAKLGRDNSMIPANVAKAINFYQSGGPLHGRAEIIAADPAQTKIIGNFHMTYEDHSINCDNYPWYARTFNKPHHEIENDLRVWDPLPPR